MPRNGAGTYTLPAGNPVITNTNITADWGNDTMEDIGNELTNSLSREGDGGMNAPLRFTDGDINAPGIAWVAETNTGFYYAGPGEFWVSVLGTDVVQFTDNGLLIPTGIDLTVQGTVSFEGALDVVGNFSVDTNKFTVAAASGNTTVAGTLAATGALTAAAATFTSASATSLAVGLTGATNPAFTVDSSTGSQVAGLKVTGAATAGTVAVVVTDSGSNASLTLNAKGSGNIGIGSVSTGAVTITPATTITGIATLTAQPVLSSLTASKPVFSDASKGLVSTGTLAYDQGGTGQTSYAAGDIVYASAINTLSKLTVGTSGQVLKVAAGVPSWATDTTTGTVTSVAQTFTGGLISVAGSPITSSGTLALTVAGASGGVPYFSAASTWASSGALTQYGVVYGGGAGAAPVATANGTTGQVLTATTSGAPSWATPATNGTVTSVGLSAPTFLTVGGSPVTTTGTLALTFSGTAIPAVNGGTAQTTYTTGDILYSNGSNTLAKLGIGTSAQVLTVTGGVPAWESSGGAGTVTSVAQTFTGGLISVAGSPITTSGTLALTVAGTSGGVPYFSSASTWATSAALTQYGVVYGGGAGATPVATAAGTTGQVLTATTSGAPSWVTPTAGGTVTSVAVSGGTTGLTTSGGPITTSGTITLAGTLAAVNGGTAQTTYTTGDLLYASSANTLSKLAVGTAGQLLKVAAGAPSWATTTFTMERIVEYKSNSGSPYTITVPVWATKVDAGVIGSGGGGGGSATATERAVGGAGGGGSFAWKDVVPGETLTITLAAGGAGGSAANGTAGGVSSIAAGTSGWTLSTTGGAAGTKGAGNQTGAAGGAGSGGDVNSTGGASGNASAANAASGGGAPGNPFGTGGASGAVSAAGQSGGGGMRAASGTVTGANSSSGGGGVLEASATCGAATASAGGSAAANMSSAGLGVLTIASGTDRFFPSSDQPLIWAAFNAYGRGGSTGLNGEPGGGGGGTITSATGANGGLGAGGGGAYRGAGDYNAGFGGPFGGGGAAGSGNGSNVGGNGGFGAGGGSAVGSTGGVGGRGGDGYAYLIFIGG